MTYTVDTSTTFISVLSLKKLNGKQYDLEMKSSLYYRFKIQVFSFIFLTKLFF